LLTAAALAKEAAPYLHPKLSSIEHKGDEKAPLNVIFSSPMTEKEWTDKHGDG
jgi:hypothetical protein